MAAVLVGDAVDVVETGKGRRRGTVTRAFGPIGNQSVDVEYRDVVFAPPTPEPPAPDQSLPGSESPDYERRSVREVLSTAQWETRESVPHINANKSFHWLHPDQ